MFQQPDGHALKVFEPHQASRRRGGSTRSTIGIADLSQTADLPALVKRLLVTSSRWCLERPSDV